MTKTYISHTPDETRQIAASFAGCLRSGDVVRIEGDLGAGKTVFAAGVARGLGIHEHITSPTYPIVAEYRGSMPLFHLDLYRIKDSAEARDTGLEDYIGNEGVTLIEWPSRAEEVLPDDCITVRISGRGDTAMYLDSEDLDSEKADSNKNSTLASPSTESTRTITIIYPEPGIQSGRPKP